MAIENRTLAAGTKLVARYKQQAYACTVEAEEDGKLAYVLADGRRFKSPSAAASAVMGGLSANGWRFWSREGDAPVATGAPTETPSPAKGLKLIRRTPNQQGAPEGQVRYFCSACAQSFFADSEPLVCPEGHQVDDPGLTTVAAG